MKAKKLVATIFGFFTIPIRALDPFAQRRFPSQKKRSWIVGVTDNIAGFFYRPTIMLKEQFRYRTNSVIQQTKAWWGFRSLLTYTLKTILLSALVFYGLYKLNGLLTGDWMKSLVGYLGLTVQDIQSMENFLGYIVGALTALLAIVFAAVSTGFQISANKYSSGVSQFVIENDDFRQLTRIFLVADVFSFTTLIGFTLLGARSYAALLLTYLLALITIVYVVRFSFYLFMLYKPRTIFSGLSKTIEEQIDTAANTDFRSKSWNILTQARKKAQQHLDLLEELYSILVKRDEYEDAYHIAGPLQYLLRKFAEKSHLVKNRERPWWGHEIKELVTYDDSLMADIKSNFEVKSEGRLFIPSRDFNWFENKVFYLFKKVAEDAVDKGSHLQFQAITYAYGYAFYGDFHDEKGVFQLATLPTAQGIIDCFLDIDVDQLDTSDLQSWLDTFFKMSVGLITLKTDNGFDEAISRSYQRIAQGRDYKPALHRQTGIYYEVLEEYAQKIRLEKAVEGSIVTPLVEYKNEIQGIVQERISDFIDNNFIKFVDASEKALKRAQVIKEHTLLAHILWMQLHWINNCLINKNFERASLINIVAHENLPLILHIPAEYIKKVELLEEIEKGFFIAVLEKQKNSYISSLTGLIFLRFVQRPQDLQDNQSSTRWALRIYSLALFAFYASEYYQDHFYIREFLQKISKLLQSSVYDALLVFKELKRYEIYWDTQTFHRWFLLLENQIRENTHITRDPHYGGLAFRTIYDHPSSYIQKLGQDHMGGIEMFGEFGFEEWLKLQKARSELLATLLRRSGNVSS
ncbi:MAG TPA: hypothetical protein VFV38_28725 [Ktedonobacteraceae bacterium]|nr:hypothetical protein [Ktedonobacteraceae bacterium]